MAPSGSSRRRSGYRLETGHPGRAPRRPPPPPGARRLPPPADRGVARRPAGARWCRLRCSWSGSSETPSGPDRARTPPARPRFETAIAAGLIARHGPAGVPIGPPRPPAPGRSSRHTRAGRAAGWQWRRLGPRSRPSHPGTRRPPGRRRRRPTSSLPDLDPGHDGGEEVVVVPAGRLGHELGPFLVGETGPLESPVDLPENVESAAVLADDLHVDLRVAGHRPYQLGSVPN